MNAEITRIREKISEAEASIAELESDRLTRDETVARLERWVDDQAAQVDIDAVARSAALGAKRIDADPLVLVASGHPDQLHSYGSLAPFICSMAGDAIKRRLIAAVDARSDELSTSQSKDRRAQLTKARKRLDDLEREEEAAIVRAEAEGHLVARRASARPEIVLAAEGVDDE